MTELYGRNDRRWELGPKITAIGGGTGLSTMLRRQRASHGCSQI